MSKTSFAQGQLKAFVDRIERLEEEKKAIASDVKKIYAEAKGTGLDTKILRKVIAIRKKDAAERQEEEAMLDVYLAALGIQPSLFEDQESQSSEPTPAATGWQAEGEASVVVSSSADQSPASASLDAPDKGAGDVPPADKTPAPTIQEPQPDKVPALAAQVIAEVLPAASAVTAPVPEPQSGVLSAPAVQEDAAALTSPVASSPPDEMPEMPNFLRRDRATATDYFRAG
jgi:uncharacterized protein (UPF0335 family)